MNASFLEFSKLCDALAATTKKLEKRRLISEYLKGLPVEDAARGALYLSGLPFAETDPRVLNLGGAQLTRALAEISGADQHAMHAAYLRHGDLGAAAGDLLAERMPEPPALTLADVQEGWEQIAAARGPAPKAKLMLDLLRRASAVEAKYLIKLASGDMRTGVKQSLVEEAIGEAYGAKPAAVRRAGMLLGSLPDVVKLAAEGRLSEAQMRLFHPLGFMLASPVESVDEAIARFTQEIAAEKSGSSADPSAETVPEADIELDTETIMREVQLEDKYDGIRAQLHGGDPSQPGRVALFSRSRDDMTASFPELAEAFSALESPSILDGEVLAWDFESNRAFPFSSLQQRIGRKKVTAQMRAQTPVVFMAFDLLYAGGDLLLERPLADRRSALERLVAQQAEHLRSGFEPGAAADGQAGLFGAPQTRSYPRVVLAPATRLADAQGLEEAYMAARDRGNEGVMLKALYSTYEPGRRGLAWLKLKRELATLDVVVTAVEYGHGKRAGILSDYTFAVRDGDELKNVGKAYSGLTDAEILELTEFFKKHTMEDFGYLRSVEPIMVLEVAFNNVMRSERHASGFALRFPRIVRIRRDKPVAEIDTLERVEEIYNSQPDKARE